MNFSNALSYIRIGKRVEECLAYINANAKRTADKDAVYIVPTRSLVKRINDNCARQFKDRKKYLTKDGVVELAPGMKVMTTSNKRGWYQNGSTGIVYSTNDKSIGIEFPDGSRVRVEAFQDGFYPVALAYALTVHKSQGQTYDSVNIIPGFYEGGQLYTALSRCRTIDGIHLLGTLTAKDMHINKNAYNFTFDIKPVQNIWIGSQNKKAQIAS